MASGVLAAGLFALIALLNLWPGVGVSRGNQIFNPSVRASVLGTSTVWAALLAAVIVWQLLSPGFLAYLAAPVAGGTVLFVLPRVQEPDARRRQQRLSSQFPEAADLLRYGLDAGLPLRSVVARVAGLSPEPTRGLLAKVVSHVETGQTDAQAWRSLTDDPVWGDLARDLARGVESGAAMSQILNVAAIQARSDGAADLQRRARSLGVKSVLPLVSCYLPAFLLVGVVPIIASTITNLNW